MLTEGVEMKKILCVVTCLVMMLSFTGCDAGTPVSESGDKETVATITKEDTKTDRTTTKKQTAEATKRTTTTQKASAENITTVKTTTTKQKTKATTVKTTEEQKNSITVYVTPSGKRYHLDPDCGGKNSSATDLDRAINMGKTPCKKCAQ